MGTDSPYSDPNTPEAVIERKRAAMGNATFVFPSDLDSVPYKMKIAFTQYKRTEAWTKVTEAAVGTIVLPIPANIFEHYRIDYQEWEAGLFGGEKGKLWEDIKAGSAWDTIKNGASGAWDSMNASDWTTLNGWGQKLGAGSDYLGNNRSGFWTFLMSVTPPSMRDESFMRAIQKYVGSIPNPHLTLTFNGVALRTFDFQWMLYPRSAAESQTLYKMERWLKARAHPSFRDTYKFSLDYPDELTVEWIGTSYLEPIKKAVIKSIDMDKAPNGPAFYKDGAPVGVGLRMEIQEVEIRTREDFQ